MGQDFSDRQYEIKQSENKKTETETETEKETQTQTQTHDIDRDTEESECEYKNKFNRLTIFSLYVRGPEHVAIGEKIRPVERKKRKKESEK